MQEQNSKRRLTWRGWLMAICVALIGVGATEFLIAHFALEVSSWMHAPVAVFWVGASVAAAYWVRLGRAAAIEAAGAAAAILLGSAATLAVGEFFSLQLPDILVVLFWCALVVFLIPSSRARILNRWKRPRAGGENPLQDD